MIILFLELQRPVLNDGWLSLHIFSLARVILEHFITLIYVDLGLVAKVVRDNSLDRSRWSVCFSKSIVGLVLSDGSGHDEMT